MFSRCTSGAARFWDRLVAEPDKLSAIKGPGESLKPRHDFASLS
jgi:hypothetical protein